jgi:hypothetical protein
MTIRVILLSRAKSMRALTTSVDLSQTVSAPKSAARLMLSSSARKSAVLIFWTDSFGFSTCTAYQSALNHPRCARLCATGLRFHRD